MEHFIFIVKELEQFIRKVWVEENTRFRKILEESKGYHNIPIIANNSNDPKDHPKDSKRFEEIPKDFERFKIPKIPKDSEIFHEILNNSERFWKIPKVLEDS